MENIQNNIMGNSSGDNQKTVLITIAAGVIVLGALVWWLKQAPMTSQQVQTSPTPDAETSAISQDIESVNVGDLNAEFDAIDQDLQGL